MFFLMQLMHTESFAPFEVLTQFTYVLQKLLLQTIQAVLELKMNFLFRTDANR